MSGPIAHRLLVAMTVDGFWRGAAIYFPLTLALIAGFLSRGRTRQFVACLVSALWTLCSLLVLQRFNILAHWWSFSSTGPLVCGMPIELYLGWTVYWGIFPQLAFPRLQLWRVVVFFVVFDINFMPICRPFATLSRDWLVGEAVAIALVFLPALTISRWTLQNTHLNLRSTLQVAISGMLFLFVLPEIVFALRPGAGWAPLLRMPSWERQLGIQVLLILAIPGVSAVMEFAQRGGGTPIPYDPPQRLVTSGVYRYCANPMQMSCGMVMLLWAGMLHNVWLLLAAVTSIVYSAGIANWDEGGDLTSRFGVDWQHYREAVPAWRVRWRPYIGGAPARLYIASTCGPCSQLRRWIEVRRPLGLELIDAETLALGSIERLRYDPGDGSAVVEGIRALARALEHLHLGWAWCGAGLRLPVVWQGVQLLMDASGLGPRRLEACVTARRGL